MDFYDCEFEFGIVLQWLIMEYHNNNTYDFLLGFDVNRLDNELINVFNCNIVVFNNYFVTCIENILFFIVFLLFFHDFVINVIGYMHHVCMVLNCFNVLFVYFYEVLIVYCKKSIKFDRISVIWMIFTYHLKKENIGFLFYFYCFLLQNGAFFVL